jgi:excisionase family DNA binding protein
MPSQDASVASVAFRAPLRSQVHGSVGPAVPAVPASLPPAEAPAASLATNRPALLTLGEAAALLRVSTRTLRRAVSARRIRCVRIGRRLLFDPADVSRFVAAGKE